MIKFTTQELEMGSNLKQRKIIVNNITFLAFNYYTDIYIGSLGKKVKLV